MRKSTHHALSRSWKGALAIALVSAAFVGWAATDPLGTINGVPDSSDIASAQLRLDGQEAASFSDEEGIAAIRALNEETLAYGGARPKGEDSFANVTFDYSLDNGRSVQRTYPVYYGVSAYDGTPTGDEGSALIEDVLALANSEKGKRSRYAEIIDASDDNPYSFAISIYAEDYGDGKDSSMEIKVPAERKRSFIEEGLAPDLLEGDAGCVCVPWGWEGPATELDVLVEATRSDGGVHDLQLWLDAELTPHTVAWLKDNYPEIDERVWEPAADE